MQFFVVWRASAEKDLAELPPHIARRIAVKVETHLAQAPRTLGKALLGEYGGYWRYRIGDYRVLFQIVDEQITIYIVQAGHRKNVYDL